VEKAEKGVKIRVIKERNIQPPGIKRFNIPVIQAREGELQSITEYLSKGKGTCGQYSKDIAQFKSVKKMLNESGIGVKEWIRNNKYGLAAAIRKSKMHIGEALDWLAGEIPVVTRILHPSLTYLMQLGLASSFNYTKTDYSSYRWFSYLSVAMEEEINNSPLAQVVYQW